ncbi:MAG TPA: cytochrome B [Anaerolineae bacterium]|nr:cytochrome B [Anaerolineae bacterium]
MTKKKAKIYTRFERFWHWSQAILIISLGFTGFCVHGTYRLQTFEEAYKIHRLLGWALVVLFIFAVFWHFTTGQWKQYLPTRQKISKQIRYYTVGIFRGEPHPYEKTTRIKLNPLQRITYLGFLILIFPVMATTGLMMIYYDQVKGWIPVRLEALAFVHTVAAFLLVTFFIVHVYMTTTGHTLFANIKAMITGYEEVVDDDDGDLATI